MVNKAPRHQRLALRNPAEPISNRRWYRVTEPTHKPDLAKSFAGVRMRPYGHGHIVALTPRQAKFYKDQGVLEALPASEQASQNAGPIRSSRPVRANPAASKALPRGGARAGTPTGGLKSSRIPPRGRSIPRIVPFGGRK